MPTADDYNSAIADVANANRIVIYCGAGVSQSLTALSWPSLIKAFLPALKHNGLIGPRVRLEEFGELQRFVDVEAPNHPLRSASVVRHYIELLAENPAWRSPEHALRHILTQILYPSYSIGPNTPLIRGICDLVKTCMLNGKSVAVVTTNYDTYLESALIESLEIPSSQDESGPQSEPISVWVRANSPTGPEITEPFAGLELVYLHGRAPRGKDRTTQPDGRPIDDGRIIFSEYDYFASQAETLATLHGVAGGSDVVVVTGSSLDDPPLVQWIQENRSPRTSIDAARPRVIVLQSVDPEPISQPARTATQRSIVSRFRRDRTTHLGVDTLLTASCFGEIPDFFRDAASEIREESAGASGKQHVKKATSEWSSAVSHSTEDPATLHRLFDLLDRGANSISTLTREIAQDFDVDFKVELWLRGLEPYPGSPEHLVKIADSSGIGLNPRMRRVDDYGHRFPARSAALRTLQFGHPEFVTLGKMGLDNSASRWQAFYSVPLESDLTFGSRVLNEVGIGALTVAYKLISHDRGDKRQDFCAYVDAKEHDFYGSPSEQRLRQALLRIGREALGILTVAQDEDSRVGNTTR